MVIAWAPAEARRLGAERHYLPSNVPLVKRVAAVAGDRVCAAGEAVFVNGRLATLRRAQGRRRPADALVDRLRSSSRRRPVSPDTERAGLVRRPLFRDHSRARGGRVGEADMGAVKLAVLALALVVASPAAADPVDRWSEYVAEASNRFGVPEAWIRRVMRAESGGRTTLNGRPIVSHAGAQGLMQLMPGTWQCDARRPWPRPGRARPSRQYPRRHGLSSRSCTTGSAIRGCSRPTMRGRGAMPSISRPAAASPPRPSPMSPRSAGDRRSAVEWLLRSLGRRDCGPWRGGDGGPWREGDGNPSQHTVCLAFSIPPAGR